MLIRGTPGDQAGGVLALWIFLAATFLSAFLLFLIQPLFAKMALPLLGGAPAVWAVALCFFQGALLVGYLWAHVLTVRFGAARAGIIHLLVMAASFVVLPIALPSGWQEPGNANPYLWQLGLFTVAIGLPFVAVGANAPLLQAWFARTRHQHAGDPYFMYAASNIGSLLALLGYPFVLEPLLGARQLSLLWSAGFVFLWLIIGLSIWQVRSAVGLERVVPGSPGPGATDKSGDGASDTLSQSSELLAKPPDLSARLAWVGLAFVPSALLTAVTVHIATDVASAPLIWVLPLALYLLTYVLVFRQEALIPLNVLLFLHLAFVIVALFELAQSNDENWLLTAAAGLAAFFTSAMVAHRTLYDNRPQPSHLTEFYLWMAFGGVLGGIFAALVAPQIFSEVYEYPLLLALTMACRPGVLTSLRTKRNEWIMVWLIAATGLFALLVLPRVARSTGFFFWGWGPTAALALALWHCRDGILSMAVPSAHGDHVDVRDGGDTAIAREEGERRAQLFWGVPGHGNGRQALQDPAARHNPTWGATDPRQLRRSCSRPQTGRLLPPSRADGDNGPPRLKKSGRSRAQWSFRRDRSRNRIACVPSEERAAVAFFRD